MLDADITEDRQPPHVFIPVEAAAPAPASSDALPIVAASARVTAHAVGHCVKDLLFVLGIIDAHSASPSFLGYSKGEKSRQQ